ncbi:beta-aspartyl-peptidase [Clostridium sp. MCC353]|uniref:beta-aspartyl-peptidase n=1 Tax=Clostridium sp. MCC353 TaxID=2592646 RepID=UPI001C01AB78|nr:beta-aspartyl-peptidase [Clostridium sp. MCC353]MBT9779102.1 beta-aspartyl-peptidase [Clostridium sp. MCC353]
MILIKQADVYGPESMGIQDVLLCAGKIEAIGENISPICGCQVIDASGMKLIPGIIDRHVHVTGGGGEGSFHTRAPEVRLSSLIRGGVTTVLGLLGTDGITRSVENLVAKVKALKEEGISAYAVSGSYGFPPVTITGNLQKDIAFVDEVIGVKLAISDHRAPNISTDELIRLASDVRTAGMLSGKAGIVVLHMGDDIRGLEPVFEALERTSIPIKTFQPTHISRTEKLLKDGFRFAKMGGTIDITCGESKRDKVAALLREAKSQGVPMENLTFSSDGQGSWSKYDENGKLLKIGVSDVDTIIKDLAYLVNEAGFALEEVLPLGTSNVAKALEIDGLKGHIREGADADILLVDDQLELHTVIAGGKVMMQDGEVQVRGTYDER